MDNSFELETTGLSNWNCVIKLVHHSVSGVGNSVVKTPGKKECQGVLSCTIILRCKLVSKSPSRVIKLFC